MNPRVINVKAEKDYHLRIWFSNGEVKIFDVTPYLNSGLFSELKEIHLFRSIIPFMGSVQWSNGLDLCPDTLYEESVRVYN